MKALFRVIGLLSMLAVSACHSPWREARHIMDRAEMLLDSQPDSVVCLISRTSPYHGELDFTEGIKSLVLNRYDGSYFSGEYMMQNLPNDFIGPQNWVHAPYQVINPPVILYNYGFIFSIRH